MKNKTDMWKNVDFVRALDYFEFDVRKLTFSTLMKAALESESGYLYEDSTAGLFGDDDDEHIDEKLFTYIKEKGGRLVYKSSGNNIYVWDGGAVEINMNGNYLSINGSFLDEKFFTSLLEGLRLKLPPPSKTLGLIYAIVKTPMGLSLSSIGDAGIQLVEGNYTPTVMEDYKFIIKDLQSSVPSGRIVIMRGSPGTGKTHLIRAMLLEVPDALFALVSPDMVQDLAGPELLPLLIQYRRGTGPIVLILEDADQCLVSRENTNINSIQSLLNLGDGILGSLLDLRIVATTNAQQLHMEEALTRPGRLSKMLEVGPLDIKIARSIYKRLLPKTKLPDELAKIFKGQRVTAPQFQITLAELYSLARKYGWNPEPRKMDVEDEENDLFEE